MPTHKHTSRKSNTKSIRKSITKQSKKKLIKKDHENFHTASMRLVQSAVKNRHEKLSRHHESIKVNTHLSSFDPNIFIKHNGNGKMIPKFHIVNSPAFAGVVISLKQGQTVYCNYGALNYMDSSIEVSTKTNGILSGLIRSLFTTSSMYLTYYTGMQDKESIISFSSFIPGDIIAMKIKPGQKYVMSSFGFLAASTNVMVSTITRFRNILGGDNIFMNEVSISPDSKEDGVVWISAYGGFDKITVKHGENVKIDQGLFAFAKREYNYDITTIGNVKSFFLSGQTIMMHFHGPCEIYVHSNNFNKFIDHMKQRIKMQIQQE